MQPVLAPQRRNHLQQAPQQRQSHQSHLRQEQQQPETQSLRTPLLQEQEQLHRSRQTQWPLAGRNRPLPAGQTHWALAQQHRKRREQEPGSRIRLMKRRTRLAAAVLLQCPYSAFYNLLTAALLLTCFGMPACM